MPLLGLSIQDGVLIYNDRQWDCMSGAEQLKVATAIVRALNPKCGFVLMDKLEQMDVDTMKEFGAWLESEGLQAVSYTHLNINVMGLTRLIFGHMTLIILKTLTLF